MSEEVANAIEDVADAIEKYGLVKGIYGHTGIGFCIEGAFMHCAKVRGVQGRYGSLHDGIRAVSAHLWKMFPGQFPARYRVIPTWNDANGRTQQEVLDTLRLVAKEVRKESDA